MPAHMTEEIDRIMANKDKIQYTLSQMVALMSDTDAKVDAMKSQKWYQRMIKTVFGKNKATKEEIASNHDKLNAYMAEAVSELFKRNAFTGEQLVCLGSQINQIYENIPEIKEILFDSVTTLNSKITSLDTYVVLTQRISVGEYTGSNPICSVFDVVARVDNRVATNEEKTNILRRMLSEKLDLNAEKTLSEYIADILKLTEPEYEALYSNAVSIGSEALWARLVMQVIEHYHFLPAAEKKALDVDTVVNEIMAFNLLKSETEFSIREIYDDLLAERINQAESTSFSSAPSGEVQRSDTMQEYVEQEATPEPDEDIAQVTEETADYEDENFEEESDEEPQEMEDYYIDHILNIDEDDALVLSYKNIHINSVVECKGSIVLKHCIVHYNESEFSDEINFIRGQEGGISATDCIFVCHGYDEHPFLNVAYGCDTKASYFKNCRFIDCSYFLANFNTAGFENCTMENCSTCFVGGVKDGLIQNSLLNFTGLADFNRKERMGTLFSVANGYLQNSKVEFADDAYTIAPELSKLEIFSSSEGGVTESTIINLKSSDYAFSVGGVDDTFCQNCVGIFYIRDGAKYEENIVSCCFENCSHIISASENTSILKCRFTNCFNNLIAFAHYDSGVKVALCEFYDCYTSEESDESEKFHNKIASLLWKKKYNESFIRFFGKKKGKQNKVEKCFFINNDAKKACIISCYILDDPKDVPVLVQNCDFRNCSSETGMLVKPEEIYYPKMSSKSKTAKTIRIYDCRGLEDVKTEFNGQKSNANAAETVEGKTVGAKMLEGIGYVALGAFVGPVAVAAVAAIEQARVEKAKQSENFAPETVE